jgi:hypothetical protein
MHYEASKSADLADKSLKVVALIGSSFLCGIPGVSWAAFCAF